MSYTLLIRRGAARQLAALPDESFASVRDRVRRLSSDPLPPDARQVSGKPGWSVLTEDCRVIYSVDSGSGQVTVLDVSRRPGA